MRIRLTVPCSPAERGSQPPSRTVKSTNRLFQALECLTIRRRANVNLLAYQIVDTSGCSGHMMLTLQHGQILLKTISSRLLTWSFDLCMSSLELEKERCGETYLQKPQLHGNSHCYLYVARSSVLLPCCLGCRVAESYSCVLSCHVKAE